MNFICTALIQKKYFLNFLQIFLRFFPEEELGSSEESGKDWSDLEREAAEEDKERADDQFHDDYQSSKKKKSNRKHSPSPSKDRQLLILFYK